MRIFFVLFIFIAGVSCDDEGMSRDSVEYFRKYLKADMHYSDLRSIFGEPDADLGSGIHVYVYDLDDNTQVAIGYTDKILYARHINETQLLEELI